MTRELTHNRIFSLSDLNAYPGREWLDRVVQLYWSADARRRVWLLAPQGEPLLRIRGEAFEPRMISARTPRWIDYGVVELPGMEEPLPSWDGFVQIAFKGLPLSTCAEAWLVFGQDLEIAIEGLSLVEVQRKLWGLAQEDVGRTTLTPVRLTAGSGATFRVRYSAGPRGLPAGAHIRFAVPKVYSLPQVEDETGPGHVQISQTDRPVEIVDIRDMLETHEKTGIICKLEGDLRPGEGFTLVYSTARTFLYPGNFDEVELRTWYSNLPPLTASVAISAAAPFVNMRPQDGHTFALVPGPSERLHLFLPGRRFASEALSVKGTYTDRYRNVPPRGPIDADISLWLDDGIERISLGNPAGRFVARHRFETPLPVLAPGVYRVFATRDSDGFEVARSNPLEIIPEGMGERLYWGEIHCHTELSDGSGDFEGVYRHAKYEGCLEFATVTDHAEYVSDNQWEWMQDVINTWNEPEHFVTLVGYEWIGKQKDRIIYTAEPRLELIRGSHQSTENLREFWGRFVGQSQVVGGLHATMVHKTKFEQHIPEVERYVEIYSMWGSSDFRDSSLVAPWIEPGRGISVNEILQQGAVLGFTGGGDCHDGRVGFASEDPNGQGTTPQTNAAIILYRCGLTAANMPRLDRKALVTALRQRRTYATTGARILLDFSVSELRMGAVGTGEKAVCRAVIYAVDQLKEVRIIKDGQVAWSQSLDGLDSEILWKDAESLTGRHYYYMEVVQEDGHRAWSSPVWIDRPG